MEKQPKYGHAHRLRLPNDVNAGPATCTICGQIKYEGRPTRTRRFFCEGAVQQGPHWVKRDPTRGNPDDGFTHRCPFCNHLARVAATAVQLPRFIHVLEDDGPNTAGLALRPRHPLIHHAEPANNLDSFSGTPERAQERAR